MGGICVEHEGTRNEQGYGLVQVGSKLVRAHRLAWEQVHGPIPEGAWVLHRCDNPPCVNVEHLFLGTAADNTADMMAKGRHSNGRTERTHCPKGHEYTDENTAVQRGRRHCRECHRIAGRERYRRTKEALSSGTCG